jgi:hypothetical protein
VFISILTSRGGYIDMSIPRGESLADTYAEVERLRKEEAYIDQQTKAHLEGIKQLLGASFFSFCFLLVLVIISCPICRRL